jgi:hypothetical protein
LVKSIESGIREKAPTARYLKLLYKSNSESLISQFGLFYKKRSEREYERSRDFVHLSEINTCLFLARNLKVKLTIENYISMLSSEEKELACKLITEFAFNLTTSRGIGKTFSRDAFTIESGHIGMNGDLSKILVQFGLKPINEYIETHGTHLTQSEVRNGIRYISRYIVDYSEVTNLKANTNSLDKFEFIKLELSRFGKYDYLFRVCEIDRSKWLDIEKNIDSKILELLISSSEVLMGDREGFLLLKLSEVIDNEIINSSIDKIGLAVKLTELKRNTIKRK